MNDGGNPKGTFIMNTVSLAWYHPSKGLKLTDVEIGDIRKL
jgi:hypothetical protein